MCEEGKPPPPDVRQDVGMQGPGGGLAENGVSLRKGGAGFHSCNASPGPGEL